VAQTEASLLKKSQAHGDSPLPVPHLYHTETGALFIKHLHQVLGLGLGIKTERLTKKSRP
jgi:hypothetical protein